MYNNVNFVGGKHRLINNACNAHTSIIHSYLHTQSAFVHRNVVYGYKTLRGGELYSKTVIFNAVV